MIKTLTSFLTKPRSLYATVELDHIELAGDRLILGALVKWSNTTTDPLEIKSVVLNLFHRGKKEAPLDLHYYGRFVRIPFQKAVAKIAGATSFHVAAGATQPQSLRFLTYDLTDLNPGTYAAELHSTVRDGTYVHEFDLKVLPALKYQTSAPEGDKQTGPLSSVYARALRIGAA
jgi:hypothetical protein